MSERPSPADGPSDEAREVTTRREIAAPPDPLVSVEQRRVHDLVRARLFGEPAEPTRVGRFALLHRLGAGGMGVVYAAYDEQLDRKVALKLLRVHALDPREGKDRLLREAQAMAKLSHPNVVTVHEVGVSEDRLFIAMELVDGRTLRAWLAERPRDWREVRDAFLDAGRGLAAAHAIGLVHRDFKPDNVMIDASGRARVLDFGLVRRTEPGTPSSSTGERAAGETISGQQDLTRTGVTMGTPAYMPPEQRAGGAVDGRSDQFSFCVALYEGLYGERPFAGSTLDEIADHVARGVVRPPPRGSAVPAWLRRAVLRGLAARPEARWPSMEALLAAIAADPGAKRRRIALATLGAALAGAAAFGVIRLRAAPAEACGGARSQIEEVWAAPQRASVQSAILGSGARIAAETWPRVEQRLDRYAEGWVAARTDACLAHRRGELSAEAFDLRMSCLERRRGELRAVVRVLADQGRNEDVVERAVTSAEGLEPLARCDDPAALRASAKPPADPAAVAAMARARVNLATAEAEQGAGRLDRALAEADAALSEATAAGHAPLVAEVRLRKGAIEDALDRLGSAKESLEAAYELALAARHDEVAARAASLLMFIHGHRERAFDAARPWERSAAALVQRLPDDPRIEAHFLNNRGLLRARQEAHTEAVTDLQRALSLFERAHGPRGLRVGWAASNLGYVLQKSGRHDEAASYLERALSIHEEALGADHPDVATLLIALSLVCQRQGALEKADAYLDRAMSITTRARGWADRFGEHLFERHGGM